MTGTNPNAQILATTEMNGEAKRIQAAFTGWNEHIALNAEFSQGQMDTAQPANDYQLMASAAAANLKIWIDGQLYEKNDSWNQFYYRGNGLENYYGKTVHVKISNGTDSAVQDMYVPQPLCASGPYKYPTYNLAGPKNNLFTWTPDPNNTTGKVAIAYQLFSDANGSRLGDMQYLIVDDNDGSFNMDSYIPAAAKGYKVIFCRGNAMSFQDGSRKFLFTITSMDSQSFDFAG